MQKNLGVVVASVFAVFATMIFSAGLAGAANEPETVGEMPDVKGMFLDQARAMVSDITGPLDLDVQTDDTKGSREQINDANWTVCWQYPKPEADLLLYQSKVTVAFGVRRSTDPDCWQ
ncbi:hypothetical protein [Mycolicibacterium hippocampi]|uniref:hypothetical protein n=1 Tax=Mycolicibacterium hippocampi TaxID=659824 RepID=UPI003512DE88